MSKSKIFIMVLGILNILAGLVLVAFVIMMQNVLAFFLGVLYIIFGIALLIGKFLSKLLYWGIIPLTVLHSNIIIMLGTNKNVPEYYQTPLLMGVTIFIAPLVILILGDIYSLKIKKRGTY